MQKDKSLIQKDTASTLNKYSDEDSVEISAKKYSVNNRSSFDKNIPAHVKEFSISRQLTSQLQLLSRNEEASIFMAMLGALNVLFYRYNNEDNISIGIPFACEQESGATDRPILFSGIVPVRNKLTAENSFTELLKEIKNTTLEASQHANHSYQPAEETIINGKDINLTALPQVMLVFETTNEESQFGILQLSGEPLTVSLSRPEINFFIKETAAGLRGTIEFNTQVYDEDRMERMSNHLKELFTSIIKSPGENISKLKILASSEEHQLLETFNDTEISYPRDKTIVNLFEEQANKNPGKVVAVFESKKLNYGELNKRSNQLARHLINLGVRKEELVPICVERSLETLVAILGILKAGAAYVPIDPEYPLERISYMLEDTAAKVVLSNKTSRVKLPDSGRIDIIEMDGHWNAISNMPAENLGTNINSGNLAYVIYTSGSTGKPKGVMIEHQAVADHCFGLIEVAQLNTCTSFALFSPLVFDAGHSIIFTSLFLGASLSILSKELIMDGGRLATYLDQNPVDCIKIVPSVWLSYVNGDNAVLANKVMIFGGETFSPKIQEHLITLNYNGIVYNHYGPTEATIGKCIHKVDLKRAYKTVPIGKPFSNTQLYVVDHWDQLVPVGVPGELYIAGEGIARKYLNRPELSSEKFIANPFKVYNRFNTDDSSNPKPLSRLYKTGDKVRWNVDGEIEYLGRIDEQVKLRGYRIELGEIENALLQNKKIKQAAVRLSEDNYGNKLLVGYVVPEDSFDKRQTIKELQEKLPEYMVPGLWVELEHLPLTSNGKINKKALPVPNVSELLNNQYAAPQNETEAALVKIWEDVLGIKKVGIYDTFLELGGNSIQAVTMFTKIRKHFGRELPLATIFQAPDISKLAAIINQKEVINLSCLVPIQPQGSNPPLFCIHAGAGNVLFYKDLSKNLGTEQPLYGLRARGLIGKEHFHNTIEEMAAHYISEIRSVQPQGPYFLAGYCLGGIIAFEMAQQLLKENERVELLATFNSRSATYLNAPSGNIDSKTGQRKPPSLSSVIFGYAGKFSDLKPKEKLVYPLKVIKIGSKITAHVLYKKTLKKALRLNAKVVKLGFDYYLSRGRLLPRLLRNKYLLHTNGYMSRAYKTEVYPGKMLVFRSPQIYKDPYLGWEEHVLGGIESYDVPGRYRRRDEIMNDPFIKVIAAKLKTFLGPSKEKANAGIKKAVTTI